MIIDINTEVLPAEYRWDPANPVTGTTKFYVRVAEELARKGHDVHVYYDGETEGRNGVGYIPRRGRSQMVEPDLVLDCNLDTNFDAPKRFQWTSFFNRTDVCVGKGYDRLFLVSQYVHSTLAHAVHCPVTVLELGCDMKTVVEPDTLSRPKVCSYTSSPDRGGRFLEAIWPEVEAATGYRLECTPYDGAYSDADVKALLDRSRFWLFPAIGTDSIISCLEAQARGCIPFVVPHMGLPETLRYGIRTDLFRFKEDLIRTLLAPETDTIECPLVTRTTALAERPIPTWADVAARILASE